MQPSPRTCSWTTYMPASAMPTAATMSTATNLAAKPVLTDTFGRFNAENGSTSCGLPKAQ